MINNMHTLLLQLFKQMASELANSIASSSAITRLVYSGTTIACASVQNTRVLPLYLKDNLLVFVRFALPPFLSSRVAYLGSNTWDKRIIPVGEYTKINWWLWCCYHSLLFGTYIVIHFRWKNNKNGAQERRQNFDRCQRHRRAVEGDIDLWEVRPVDVRWVHWNHGIYLHRMYGSYDHGCYLDCTCRRAGNCLPLFSFLEHQVNSSIINLLLRI